jgi:hypothetical protein
MIDCHFALQTKILTKNTAGNCEFIFDELQSPGNISYANCCWVELATNKVLWVIMPLLLVQVLSKKRANHLCFPLPLILFFPLHLGRESGVYRVPCWFWILEEGTQTETKLNCPPSLVSFSMIAELPEYYYYFPYAAGPGRSQQWFRIFFPCSLWSEGKERSLMIVVVTRTGSGRSQVWFPTLFNAPCDLKERRELFHRCSKNRIGKIFCRCDFRLCSIFPVIWRKGEIRSIVVARTGSGRYSQVRFPTLWNAPYDLKESRKLDDCCCKKRIGDLKSLPTREEYIRSSTERFAAICCLKKLGFVLVKLGRSVQAFVSQIGKFVRFLSANRPANQILW